MSSTTTHLQQLFAGFVSLMGGRIVGQIEGRQPHKDRGAYRLHHNAEGFQIQRMSGRPGQVDLPFGPHRWSSEELIRLLHFGIAVISMANLHRLELEAAMEMARREFTGEPPEPFRTEAAERLEHLGAQVGEWAAEGASSPLEPLSGAQQLSSTVVAAEGAGALQSRSTAATAPTEHGAGAQ